MSGLNLVVLGGRVGKDPELKSLAFGDILTISLATSETWKDKNTGEKKEKTEWHECVLFGDRAKKLAEYIKKGDYINVTGKLQTDKYQKDGQDHYRTKINVSDVVLTGKAGGNASAKPAPFAGNKAKPAAAQDDFGGSDQGDDGDLPF